jgi:heat shock protein HslJ
MKNEIRSRLSVLLAAILVISILSGCGLLGENKNELEGTRWQLQSMDGNAPPESVVVTAEFNDGRISGSSGCNSYGAAYTAKDGKLSLDAVAMTEMACQDSGVMDTEQEYLKLLNTAKSYTISTDQLDLLDESGNIVLSFSKQPEN